MSAETSPLLALPPGGPAILQRIHFLDNLRSVLTILLIFHHSTTEAARAAERWQTVYPKSQMLPLALFVTVNKAFLWGMFFLISGYAARLSLQTKSDYQFLSSRLLKTALPAFIYLVAIRRAIITFLSAIGWEIFFGSAKWPWAYAVLAGPGPYICFLLILDASYLLVRWSGRRYPSTEITHLTSKVHASSSSKFIALLVLSFILVAGITFGNCLGLRLIPFIVNSHFSMDFPGFGAPITYIIAYIAGINFPIIEQYLIIKNPARAVSALVATEITAYLSLLIAQWRCEALWGFMRPQKMESEGARWFIDGGFNWHTLFFTLWNPIMIIAISITLISTFASTRPTKADWGIWSKYTILPTYIHMLPVVMFSHFDSRYGLISNLALRALVHGVVGVVISWIAALGLVKAWLLTGKICTSIHERRRRGAIALPTEAEA